VLHIEGSRLEELHHVVVNRLRVRGDPITIDAEKDIYHGKRDPLVAIYEGMSLNEAFEKRGGLMNESVVVTGLRSMKS